MAYRPNPPTLDLLPDGRVRPAAPGLSIAGRVFAAAVVVAVLGAALSLAALAFWLLAMLIPVVLVAAGVAWAALKVRRWQGRGAGPVVLRWPPRPR